MLDQLDRGAVRNGLVAALLLSAGIYLGSGGLRRFDPALIAYTSATVFAAFGIVYRYSVWLEKPPTRMYWRRGWQILLRPARLVPNALHLLQLAWRNLAAQTFIDRRSHTRWAAHFLLSWGCLLACGVTFPLVFGWVHFEADPSDPSAYVAYLFGLRAGAFPAYSVVGWITFHLLDFCAVAILVGMGLAFKRRLYDPGAMTVQQFANDFLPLILLFAVCVTGLMLTASALWMHGHSYSFLALLHAFSVIVTLLYMPFGKFFHVFQRPANLGVQYYKEEGRRLPPANCRVCGEAYASSLHLQDLKTVLAELGIDQRLEDGAHYQEVCPACRRKMLAAAQREAIGGPGFL